MAHSLHVVYLHVVFGCKFRSGFIREDWRERVEVYLSGIAHGEGHHIEAIYCMPDHCHFLMYLNPAQGYADALRILKAKSSRWIKDEFSFTEFAWQTGYAAFSVSHTHRQRVRSYILNQPIHHARNSFEQELRELFALAGETIDEKELYRWVNGY